MSTSLTSADIGLIGLAVMGQNLVLNMEDHGFTVAVFNRTYKKTEDFVAANKTRKLIGCETLKALVKNLKRPRRVMMMVKAGKPVDEQIEALLPLLEKGDIIIDGGNSHFADTIRRTKYLESKGLLFIGTGVSGGEEGARRGPSIMPGGSPKAWNAVKPIFQSISAKVADGSPCCDWVGNDGAGHFVKTTHNGIEYGDMQLICEAYSIMKNVIGLKNDEIQKTFATWNRGDLKSYLIEITADIFSKKDTQFEWLAAKSSNDDPTDRKMDKNKKAAARYRVDMILDTAGQKGTGKWTSVSALDLGIPAPQIAEAVFARCLSAIKDERLAASKLLPGPKKTKASGAKAALVKALHDAVYAAKICSYAQGFQMMRAAAAEHQWALNYGNIALMWREGCIIRAAFLDKIKAAFTKKPQLANLLLDGYFKKIIEKSQNNWRKIVALCAECGVSAPSLMSALAYYDGYRSAVLPANLLQAQRDYFGAHTYERTDEKRGVFYHTEWMK